MGKWYVVEILEHMQKDSTHQNEYRVTESNTCPIIRIKSTDPHSLKLFWSEEAGDVAYHFNVDLKRAGFWTTNIKQNGTLVDYNYLQFVGKVYVMKAVATHMVLTFCSSSTDQHPGLLYSVLMSRNHILNIDDINGVHKLLNRRELKLSKIKKSCANGGANIQRSNLNLGWLVLLGIITSSGLFSSFTWH
ncbi:uncharacterized protein LOC127283417 isoform X2 [Leptopilina boulardi]|nr:uncharacterized protein LOC127283417 isoform X2 [Leptopilina boulardi]XP_051164229.1 uncharacterized protein LOC127283417 isoform X2 [Leptopilina boulardi]XP_051164230.1 uncharacterized protein LOC127283417 isoform X2 [Leptopilina boulardi]